VSGSETAQAINRLADAEFQRASIEKKQLRVAEQALEIQRALLEMQAVNLAVTRQLESALAVQGVSHVPQSAQNA
jgi:hypothetical protein